MNDTDQAERAAEAYEAAARNARDVAAGRLLRIAVTNDNRGIALFAEAAAKVTAEHGLETARGWLRGIWHVGGNHPIVHQDDAVATATTYWHVVWSLQDALGVQIVTRREPISPVQP